MPSEPVLESILRETDPERILSIAADRGDELDPASIELLADTAEEECLAGRTPRGLALFWTAIAAALVVEDAPSPLAIAVRAMHITEEAGDTESATAAADIVRQMTEELLEQGVADVLPFYADAVVRSASKALERGDTEHAGEIAAGLRTRAQSAGATGASVWGGLLLARVMLDQERWSAAQRYVEAIAADLASMETTTSDDVDPPTHEELADTAVETAHRLYTVEENLAATEHLAEIAIAWAPADWRPYILLGRVLTALDRTSEALPIWQRAVELAPEMATCHRNLAGALTAAGRHEEALAALDEAVRLDPKDPSLWFVRGTMRREVGHYARAIDDFRRAVELGSALPLEERAAPRRERQNRMEQLRAFTPDDITMIARSELVKTYVRLEAFDEALAEIESFAAEDEADTAFAQMMKATVFEAAGRTDEAIAASDAAIDAMPDLDAARLARADLLIAGGRTHDALEDLRDVAHKNRDPAAAIDRLDKLAEAAPEDAAVRKIRGYAHWQAMHPPEAEDDLNFAAAQLPTDFEAVYWRGLNRITLAPEDLESPWNSGIVTRLPGAISDLAAAARLDPGRSEAFTALRWLLDRVTIQRAIRDLAFEIEDVRVLLPGALRAEALVDEGFAVSGAGDWRAALELFAAAQEEFIGCGLELSAIRLNVPIADNLLRLYELQPALDHLERAQAGYAKHWRPLTEELHAPTEEVANRVRHESASEVASAEFEYLLVYTIGFDTYMTRVRLLKAQALARIGDLPGALAALGDIDELVAQLKAGSAGEPALPLFDVATIARDAEEYDLAMTLLDTAEEVVTTDLQRVRLHNTRATVFQQLDSNNDAREELEKASDLAHSAGLRRTPMDLNLAQVTLQLGDPGAALARLDSVADVIEKETDRSHFNYLFLRARALEALDRHEEALEAQLAALELADRERAALRDVRSRIVRQGRVEPVYAEVVATALAVGRTGLALEIVERSKSRAFVDLLAAGHSPLPPSARELRETEQRLRRQLQTLATLEAGLKRRGPAYVDWGLVEQLDEGGKLVTREEGKAPEITPDGVEELRGKLEASIDRVQDLIEDARAEHDPIVAVPALSLDELRSVLT